MQVLASLPQANFIAFVLSHRNVFILECPLHISAQVTQWKFAGKLSFLFPSLQTHLLYLLYSFPDAKYSVVFDTFYYLK